MPTRLYQMAQQPRGLILVTGPTGSGKSTTLAAMIEHINQNSDRQSESDPNPAGRYSERNCQPVSDPLWRSGRSGPDSRNRTPGGYRCDPEPDPGGKDAPDFCNDAGGWKRRYAYPEYGSVPTDAAGLYHERTCQRIYEQSGRTGTVYDVSCQEA